VSNSFRLLEPAEIAGFPWRADQQQERRFLTAFAGRAPHAAANLRTRLLAVQAGSAVFPLTVNDGGPTPPDPARGWFGVNSYVVSPRTAYIAYARDELHKLELAPLRHGVAGLIGLMDGRLLAARMDRIVYVNNWLLSTHLYPAWREPDIAGLTAFLTALFPDHYIAFRSLNRRANSVLMDAFTAAGYGFLPARQVYLYGADGGWRRKKNVKWDLRLLASPPAPLRRVAHEDLDQADFPRMVELYNMLYLDKYSRHNPAFTEEFMRHAHATRLLEFQGLRDADGRLAGILGAFTHGGIVTAPVVGYDTGMPPALGLYRMVVGMVYEQALERGIPLNLSAGAGYYKRLRGGVPHVEYTAIYDRHLTPSRRLTRKLLGTVLQHIGAPLLRRYEL